MDNIITNELCTSGASGILVTDITDHLPIFAFINYNVIDCKTEKQVKRVRYISDNTLSALCSNLELIEWSSVVNISDVHVYVSDDWFMELFLSKFKNCCPMKNVNVTYLLQLKNHG